MIPEVTLTSPLPPHIFFMYQHCNTVVAYQPSVVTNCTAAVAREGAGAGGDGSFATTGGRSRDVSTCTCTYMYVASTSAMHTLRVCRKLGYIIYVIGRWFLTCFSFNLFHLTFPVVDVAM